MASQSGVQVLELHLIGDGMNKWYNLPLCVAEAKSLTKLVLSGGIKLDRAFLKHSLKFFSMRTLSFSNILFGCEGVMEHFISHCPLIEHLTLDLCNVYNPLSEGDPPDSRTYLVKSLSLQGLQKLKELIFKEYKRHQYFYEMLMDSNKCKCDGCSMHFKRWWRCLKVVKVTHLGRTYENVQDLKAMLNALPEPESDLKS
ncbi:hypothetical protein PIB30_042670 [Stylosanthes scabra]|uniref:F-box/LRR-repeat protein 15/At3g58940/PEG3-like LRR domain-containing protein n=1 Tax=Stylosanthes scabra TaxID=79078 RepID=A0ABU6UDX8_9FABA|nr:hypothetical protein [Stylosanthes scabra]